ncbi:GNAT family protein [Vibrio sp. SCSIO 43136]|uniref:GNAT family N-acetyltransferase n=1 Tax=Vibrio sp. SCSIO 43136 TaxID=2819101 RepID=UPI002075C5CD|nr:GNAT family protein [Vibrio sp. SCSIO 43136]USD64124.1 GNAT family N-acetyltransferase [Vibrio sp. SCSIO 43136]
MQDNLYKFPVLCHSDGEALLRFEQRNRLWFEEFVEQRPEGFYCMTGISNHIRQCLHQYHELTMLPTLIKNGRGEILGRANLHRIDLTEGEAWVGYRVSEKAAGQGLATRATSQLINYARTFPGLKRLKAYAAVQNVASQRVLLNNNFTMIGKVGVSEKLSGAMLDCYEYQLDIQGFNTACRFLN